MIVVPLRPRQTNPAAFEDKRVNDDKAEAWGPGA